MKNLIIIVLLFVFCLNAQNTSNRLRAMGDLSFGVVDSDSKINLYRFGGNNAFLKENDSTDWGRYATNSINECGDLHRTWDAEGLYQANVVFEGQKHLSESQAFYGSVCYNRDFYNNVYQSLERYPYAKDPFVLTDFTTGDFNWYGPLTEVVYSHKILNKFYFGASLKYGIQQGLKKQNSMAETVSRDLSGSLDIAWRITPKMTVGFSYKPYSHQDIIYFDDLPDGSAVYTKRYKGEIKYNYHVGETDRTINFSGYENIAQLNYQTDKYQISAFAGYYYLWQKIFDGTSTQTDDGFYQDEAWFLNSIFRRYFNKVYVTLAYNLYQSDGWAKEPTAGFLIYRAKYLTHTGKAGIAYNLNSNMLLATEFIYESSTPDRNDYLGRQYRKGENVNLEWHVGGEYKINSKLDLRAGFTYKNYSENKVWDYFGNYSGPSVTAGASYLIKSFRIDGIIKYGQIKNSDNQVFDSNVSRDYFDVSISVKQNF